jgi:GBP family porin
MKKTLIVAAVSASFATAASAQSSVTLYGIVDAGLTYVNHEVANNEKGYGPAYRLSSGNLQGSRWGLRGAEDLGGGMKAIFTVESGFNINDGTSAQGGRLFGRQAYVGLSSNFGTVTLGRQYDSVVDYIGPLTANGSWGGTYFSHPFDNDNTDNSFRINNSIKYQSANYGGFTFGGLYGFSNQAGGFASNRAYSMGAGYQNGPIKLAAAYLQTQGTNSGVTSGAIQDGAFGSNGFAVPSESQRTYGVGGSYAFGAATVGAVFTQSRFQFALGDASARFNNYEVNARYNVTPALALGAAYTYTQMLNKTPGDPSGSSHWNQFGLQADYALSKRTDLYAEGVVQLSGEDGITQIYGTRRRRRCRIRSSCRRVSVTASKAA